MALHLLNWTLGPSVAGDAQRAMQMIFDRCNSEPACQKAFPNLSTEFDALLMDLASQPVEVELNDPVSGEPTKVTLDYESFCIDIPHHELCARNSCTNASGNSQCF